MSSRTSSRNSTPGASPSPIRSSMPRRHVCFLLQGRGQETHRRSNPRPARRVPRRPRLPCRWPRHLAPRLKIKPPHNTMPNTRVFLVRHGATILTAEDRFAGAHRYPPLRCRARPGPPPRGAPQTGSSLGPFMPRRFGPRTNGDRIRSLPCPTPKPSCPSRASVEINHGRWEQMTRTEVEQQFPDEAEEWRPRPLYLRPEGRRRRPRCHRPGFGRR